MMYNKYSRFQKLYRTLCPVLLLVVFPVSSHYELRSFEFGGGGGVGASSQYGSETVLGENTASSSSTNYTINSGLVYVQNANEPGVPAFTNDSNWYNKLKLVLNTASNPTDTTYVVAISSDNWVTTKYVQTDGTIGTTPVYQTYTAWGSATGSFVIGLSSNTTYKVKVKAIQGRYTETAYSPEANAATANVSLSFDIDIAPTDQSTNPPYNLNMGNLTPGSVTTASDKIWISLSTNAASGGSVYIYDQYAGLRSSSVNYTISSASTDLTGATEGFGIQGSSQTQSTGGPLSIQAPYDGTANSVGVVDSVIRTVYTSSNSPVTGGRASLAVKAKTSNLTPASSDYVDGVNLIAAGSF